MSTDEKTANFKTNCGTCIFAQYDENNKQNDCDLDRLTRYISSNKAIFDEEKQCFIIQTICNCCRGEQWANNKLGKNLIAEVENEIKIKMDFIILVLNQDMEKVEKRLPDIIRRCKNQERIKPKSINIILQSKEINSTEIYKIMLEENDPDIKFNLVRILDLSYNKGQCIDSGVKKCKGSYYCVFELCDNIPVNLIKTFNELINYKLKNINMIHPYKNFSGLIVQTFLHKTFGGNKNVPIYEKVTEAAEIQDKKENIYEWDQLWSQK